MYLLVTVDQTFFPIVISGNYVDTMRQERFMSFINLMPFYFVPFGTLESSFNTLLLNVALTIPFGFGNNFMMQVEARNILRLAITIGLEMTQLVISLLLGYMYRY